MKARTAPEKTGSNGSSPRGEGLNTTERSILSQSLRRHDTALRILGRI